MPCAVTGMSKHHTEIQRFRIFALILKTDFFVGKTTSPRISAIYSRHRCGKVAATRETMDQEHPPSLYILEELKCTGAEAYRHVLAWIRRFEEAGYCTINHMGTAIASKALYPPTEVILSRLLTEPMDQLLERTYVPKPSAANWKPSRIQSVLSNPEKHVQMNLRMTPKDKRRFDLFCKSNNLKAREALGLLLDQITGDEEHLRQMMSEQKTLRQENENLKNQLAVRQGKILSPMDQKPAEHLQFLKKGLVEYTGLICPNEEETSLPVFPYKQFRTQSDIRYEYPESEGFLLLRAEAMLWGRHRSRFIVGRGQNGEYLKVRYYPNPLYVGAFLWDYPAGTQWLVGCRRAADGAMEVAAVFPLPLRMESAKTSVVPIETERRISLDDQIRNASAKM